MADARQFLCPWETLCCAHARRNPAVVAQLSSKDRRERRWQKRCGGASTTSIERACTARPHPCARVTSRLASAPRSRCCHPGSMAAPDVRDAPPRSRDPHRRMCVTHPLDPAIPKIPQSSDPRDLNPLPIPQSNPASRCRTPMPQSHAAGQTSGIGPLPSARVSRESVSGCAPRTTFFSSSCGPRAEPIQIRQRILLRWDLDRCADLRRQRRCVESCCCIASEEWEATHADHTC